MCKIQPKKYTCVKEEVETTLSALEKAQAVVEAVSIDSEFDNLVYDGEGEDEADEVFEEACVASPARPSRPAPPSSLPVKSAGLAPAVSSSLSSLVGPVAINSFAPPPKPMDISESETPVKTATNVGSSSGVQSTRKRSPSVDEAQLNVATAPTDLDASVRAKKTRYEAARDAKVEHVPLNFFSPDNEPSDVSSYAAYFEDSFNESDYTPHVSRLDSIEELSINLLAVLPSNPSRSSSVIAVVSPQPSTSSKHSFVKTSDLIQDQPVVQAVRPSVIMFAKTSKTLSEPASPIPPPLCHSTPVPPPELAAPLSNKPPSPVSPVAASPAQPATPPQSPSSSTSAEPEASSSSIGLPPNLPVPQPVNPYLDGGYGNQIEDIDDEPFTPSPYDSGTGGSSGVDFAVEFDPAVVYIQDYNLSLLD